TVKVYNTKSAEEYFAHRCHDSYVDNVKCSKDGTLLLTSNVRRRPFSAMWNIERNQFSSKLIFNEDEFLEFSKLDEDKILGANPVRTTIYDIRTGQAIASYKSFFNNYCSLNRATFSPLDDLILSG
ncbi:DDB1- and CUL4-associated factor 1, partial [Pseudolycoriella hygida]